MREVPVSNCENNFIVKCIEEKKRIDGRKLLDYRPLTLAFGLDHGCCVVSLGDTKVMAQVTAEMDRPKESRSNEGNLGIFIEMSTMGSPGFDPAKPGNLGVELQRMLERSIILSKCVDLEGLCIRVGEYAWNLSLRLQILSHDGNLLDCASIASLTALGHFKCQSVTTLGKDVTVHTFEEKDPVSLTINHQPFCTSFSFFNDGKTVITDPTRLEEECSDGKLMISMNRHREVCTIQMSGRIQISKDQILKCVNLATSRVKELSDLVKKALQSDVDEKKKGLKTSSTSSSVSRENLKELCEKHVVTTEKSTAGLPEVEEEPKMEAGDPMDDREARLCWVMNKGEDTAMIVKKEAVKMKEEDKEDDSESEEEEVMEMKLGLA